MALSYWLPLHVDVVAADLVDQAIVEGLQRIDDFAGCLGRKRGDDDRCESFDSSGRTFDCRRLAYRDPRETKGMDYRVTETSGEGCCGPEGCG